MPASAETQNARGFTPGVRVTKFAGPRHRPQRMPPIQTLMFRPAFVSSVPRPPIPWRLRRVRSGLAATSKPQRHSFHRKVFDKSTFARDDGFWLSSVVIVQQTGTGHARSHKTLKGKRHFG